MFSFNLLNHVLFLFMFYGYDCQRRIHEGTIVSAEKKYVVYLLKATISPQNYDSWLCGGALVTTDYIVTSAACVTDVVHLYAIAGYKNYISEVEIYTDPCTKEKKKKVIFTCVPLAYELVYNKPQKWSNIDIAVVKVESPYDFNDASFAKVCSYIPAAITINYETKYQEPGIDAIVLGWGHLANYREEMDLVNYNEKMLHYAPTLVEDKTECKKEYSVYEGMAHVIDKYMICTNKKGNLDDSGRLIIEPEPKAQGCLDSLKRLRGEISCENAGVPEDEVVLMENSRKNIKPTNFTINKANRKSNYLNNKINNSVIDSNNIHKSSLNKKNYKTVSNSRRLNTRRHGICQNDHGGPLVTWVGAHEMLIGVASAFKITKTRQCTGPFLFTSTQCNGAFLNCVLRSDYNDTRRGSNCSLLNEKGFKLLETNISWIHHPDGPADNEKNVTAHASAANTETKSTLNLINSTEEEKPKQQHYNNATEFVNTNTTNLTNFDTTHVTKNLNMTSTTKAVNLGSTTSKKQVKITDSVIFTSNTSTKIVNNANVTNDTFTSSTDTTHFNSTSTKHLTNTTKSNVNTITTIVTKTATVTLRNATKQNMNTMTTILTKIASVRFSNTTKTNESLKTTTVNLTENASLTRITNLGDMKPGN